MNIEEIRRLFVAQGNQMADQVNQASLQGFRHASQNRADYWAQVQTPKPTTPKVVEARFDFADETKWRMELVATDRPVTDFDPDSLLPVIPTSVGAVGGLVGGRILDEHGNPQAGMFHMAAGDNTAPGTVTEVSGRKFVKIAEGFAGLRRYWLEVK